MIPTGVERSLSSVKMRQSTGKAWLGLVKFRVKACNTQLPTYRYSHGNTNEKSIDTKRNVGSVSLGIELIVQAPGDGKSQSKRQCHSCRADA